MMADGPSVSDLVPLPGHVNDAENMALATATHAAMVVRSRLYDRGIATPLLLRWKGRIPAGVATDDLVSTVDLAPTLLELVGLEVPDWMQGVSFAAGLQPGSRTTS